MSKTKIILVRHGQSIGNLTRRFLGHTDLDLSDQGYVQANATAVALKNEKIDKIYSSDLIRAYNTAVPHSKMHNLPIICCEGLREAYVGEWEGLLFDEIVEKWGREVFENQWHANFGRFVFPGGESIIDAGERFYNEIIRFMRGFFSGGLKDGAHLAYGFLTGILRVAKESIFSGLNNIKICSIIENEGKTILICAHAAVIRSFWGKISNISPDMLASSLLFPTNASYSICYYENGKISPSDYSIDDHLREVGITKFFLK